MSAGDQDYRTGMAGHTFTTPQTNPNWTYTPAYYPTKSHIPIEERLSNIEKELQEIKQALEFIKARLP